METYINTFQNLGGTTIGEHKHHFNTFLRTLRSLPSDDIDHLINNLQPSTIQEEIFYTKTLITFKKTEKLLETLYKGNIILNKIMLTNAFEDLFETMDPITFTKTVCPNISHVIRIKIVHKLSNKIRDTNTGNSYFFAILEEYGLTVAERLLAVCSEDVVRETVTEHKVRLTSRQLIKLHETYDGFLSFYLKEMGGLCGCRKMVRYLVIYDIRSYFALFEYFSGIKIGRNGCRNFLKHYRSAVVEDPRKYLCVVRVNILLRSLSDDEYLIVVRNLLPKNKTDFNPYGDYFKFVKYLPVAKRGLVFFRAFEERYGSVLTDPPCELIKIFGLEERLRFNLSEDEHLPLLGITDSVARIKHRIIHTCDWQKRKDLLVQLLETCKINYDLDAVLEVLKYIIERHKNEIFPVRQSVASYLLNNFALASLNEAHWRLIDELMLIFHVNGEHFPGMVQLVEKRIHYKLLKGIDYIDDLKEYMQLRGTKMNWNLIRHKPVYERTLLTTILELLPNFNETKSWILEASTTIIKSMCNFNKRNKKLQISYFDYPDILMLFLQHVKKTHRVCSEALCKILLSPVTKQEHYVMQVNFRETYIEECLNILPDKLCLWLLRHKPDFVSRNLSVFLKKRYLDGSSYEIAKMRNSDLPIKMRDYHLEQLNGNKDLIAALNFLSYEKNFVDIVRKYHPNAECKIDLHDGEMKKDLVIQKCILAGMKNNPRPFLNLQLILNYCNSDYLQYALKPLYFSCYHSPTNLLNYPIKTLLTRSVSVRKHAIHLTFTTCEKTQISKLLTDLVHSEKNTSIRKFAFKSCFKFFCKNPSDHLLELFNTYISLLPNSDPEVNTLLYNFTNIPRKFLPRYIKLVWNFVEIKNYAILHEITSDVIRALDNDFCDELVKASLFSVGNYNIDDTNRFISNYLYHAGESLEGRIELLFDCMKSHINSAVSFQETSIKTGAAYSVLESIVIWLIEEEGKSESRTIIKSLHRQVQNLQLPQSKFIIEVLLDVNLHYIEINNYDHKSFAKYLHEYTTRLIQKYGNDVVEYFREFVKHYLRKIFVILQGGCIGHFLGLVEELLEIENCLQCQLLAVYLLPENIAASKDLERHSRILEKIQSIQSPIVLLYLERYFRGF